jgi:hypothetical protein
MFQTSGGGFDAGPVSKDLLCGGAPEPVLATDEKNLEFHEGCYAA